MFHRLFDLRPTDQPIGQRQVVCCWEQHLPELLVLFERIQMCENADDLNSTSKGCKTLSEWDMRCVAYVSIRCLWSIRMTIRTGKPLQCLQFVATTQRKPSFRHEETHALETLNMFMVHPPKMPRASSNTIAVQKKKTHTKIASNHFPKSAALARCWWTRRFQAQNRRMRRWEARPEDFCPWETIHQACRHDIIFLLQPQKQSSVSSPQSMFSNPVSWNSPSLPAVFLIGTKSAIRPIKTNQQSDMAIDALIIHISSRHQASSTLNQTYP